MKESTTVYGVISRPLLNETPPKKGWVQLLFQSHQGDLSPIDPSHNLGIEAFLQDGYHESLMRYYQQLIEVDLIENNYYDPNSENLTPYVTFKNNFRPLKQDRVVAFVEMPLPDALAWRVKLPAPPLSKHFFIVDQGSAFGPFQLQITPELKSELIGDHQKDYACEGRLIVQGSEGLLSQHLADDHIACYDFTEVREVCRHQMCHINGVDFLLEPPRLKSLSFEPHPYLTAEAILHYLTQMSNRRIFPKSNLALIRKELQDPHLGPWDDAFKAKIERVCEAASQEDDWMKSLIEIVQQSDSGKPIIKAAVEQEKSRYLQDWDQRAAKQHKKQSQALTKQSDQLARLDAEIAAKQQQLHALESEMQQVQKAELAKPEMASEATLLAEQTVSQRISEAEQVLAELTQQIEQQQAQHANLSDQVQVQQQISKSLAEDLQRSDLTLQIKLQRLMPYVAAAMGRTQSISSPESNVTDSVTFPRVEVQHLRIEHQAQAIEQAQAVLTQLMTTFNQKHQRRYSQAFLLSVLVAHFQSRLCVFSGAPGLGKTSFVRILQQALALGERFIEVPVGRNWLSERELVGFYNPLTQSFSAASSGLYPYLQAMAQDQTEQAPSHLVLLDEANLSPIEHYAANLLNISDSESQAEWRFGPERFRIPSSFRTIATINYDMTTEPLSPRLIDRVAVIPFEGEIECVFVSNSVLKQGKGKADEPDSSRDNVCYSEAMLNDLFGSNAYWLHQAEVAFDFSPLVAIIQSLKASSAEWGTPFMISHRKQLKLSRYVFTLAGLLHHVAGQTLQDSQRQALDFGVLYFLLPVINGHGQGTLKRIQVTLERLREHQLTQSANKLNDMIQRGQYHLDSYNFFAY